MFFMKKYELNMSSGSILKNLVLFSWPLMLSKLLQLLYNAVDIIVVGKFEGDLALASVGATSSLINLFVNVFMGYATGAGVVISRYFGANDTVNTKRAVSTCIKMSLCFGIFLMIAGNILSTPMLRLMSCPDDVIGGASLYMKIYFLGMPAFMIYNFGSGVLRAVGDTKRPLRYLTIAGMINVVLNLVFVIVFKIGVAGVALATTISQVYTAICVIRCLVKTDASYKLDFREFKFYKKQFVMMTKIGFPAGIQSSLFAISNVTIQSSINTFGSIAIAGNSVAANIDNFIYAVLNSFSMAALTFTGQNFGANKPGRIKKGLGVCLMLEFVVTSSIAIIIIALNKPILSIYTSDPEVMRIALEKMMYIGLSYFLCGFYEVFVAVLRGLGCSVIPMITSIFGICGLRLIYIMTVFKKINTLSGLYITYPASWVITTLINALILVFMWKKLVAKE